MSKKQKNMQELDMEISDSSDVALQYPTLLSVWQQNEDCMTSYDLRQLQQELEYFLLALRKQVTALINKQSNAAFSLEKKEESFKAFDIGETSTPVSEDKPSKRAKPAYEKGQKPTIPARAKCKRTQSSKSQDYGFPEKSDIPKAQKNDAPNRFWSFIDPYCADITIDDIKMLEKWIESHDQDSEYQDIPPLGVHYGTQWTEDGILEEMREGSKSVENPRGMDYSSIETNSGEDLNRVKNKYIDSTNSQHSPLVQKLISSLVHENIITSPSDIMTEPILENGLPEKKVNLSKAYPQVDIDTLENRLRMHLQAIGVLEKTPKELDDELLLELKQLQHSLIPVSKYNQQKKQNLLARAKAEMARQEAQKRINEADAKVMEVYRTMSAIRSKGKNLGKKEFCQIKTILEERNSLIKNSKATC